MTSAVMLCFNAEPVIERTLDDFANQIYKNFEPVIVNDGPTDRSEAVVRTFIDRNNLSWIVLSQPKKGLSAARNIGIDLAKSDHIVFCGFDLVDQDNIQIKKI